MEGAESPPPARWPPGRLSEWLDLPLPAPGWVVDLGAGDGRLSLEAAKLTGRRVVAVDRRAGAGPEIRALCEGWPVRTITACAEATGLPSGCAALVLALRLLHQVAEPGLVVEEMSRLLTLGGVAVVGQTDGFLPPLEREERIEWAPCPAPSGMRLWRGKRK